MRWCASPYSGADACSNTRSDSGSDSNTDTRSHAGANAHSYPNTQSYPNTDAHPDADSHTHTHSGTHFLALGPHQFNSRGCPKRAGKPAAPRFVRTVRSNDRHRQ
jgi:hypothetical protein